MLNGKQLGDAIAWAIAQKGVTKKAFADAMGVKPASVQDWIKYGRVSKHRISPLVDYFRNVVPPEYWGLNFDLNEVGFEPAEADLPALPSSFESAWEPYSKEGEVVARLVRALYRAVDHRVINAAEIEALARLIEARSLQDQPEIAKEKLNVVMAAIDEAERGPLSDNKKPENEQKKRRNSST